MFLLTPKGFLKVGGIVLILVALLGFFGVIGPTPERSLFGPTWYFDDAENWAHLVLGVVALIAAAFLKPELQKPLVMILGLVGVVIGLYSVFGPVTEGKTFLGANLENPTDSLLHIVVGVWALVASMKQKKDMPTSV